MADDTATTLTDLLHTLQDYSAQGIAEVVVTPERLAALTAAIAAVRAEAAADRVVAQFIDHLRPLSDRDPR